MAATTLRIVVNTETDTGGIILKIREFCEKFHGDSPEEFVNHLLQTIIDATHNKYNVMIFDLSTAEGPCVTPEGVVHCSTVNAFKTRYGIWVFSGKGQWTNLSRLGWQNWAGHGNLRRYDQDGTPNDKDGRVVKFSLIYY